MLFVKETLGANIETLNNSLTEDRNNNNNNNNNTF